MEYVIGIFVYFTLGLVFGIWFQQTAKRTAQIEISGIGRAISVLIWPPLMVVCIGLLLFEIITTK